MSFPPPFSDAQHQESGAIFAPRFDAHGLVTAVAVDHASQRVLMVAHMNAEAIRQTLSSGYAHYWSRSRASLWKKGESSGELQRVRGLYVDCDQDAIIVQVDVEGRGSACHNGYRSCFYRKIVSSGPLLTLETVVAPLVAKDTLYPTK